MKVLVTGAAGFIGMHCALRLLGRGDEVIGLDNLNDYYDVRLKEARLAKLTPHPRFRFFKLEISDQNEIRRLFAEQRPQRVLHLAAQAGVRYAGQSQCYGKATLSESSNSRRLRLRASHLIFA